MTRPTRRPQPSPMLAAALLLGLGLPMSHPGDALAVTLCSEPVEPICATAIPATDPNAATDQGVARHRCIEDATTYREKLDEYRQCLEDTLSGVDARVDAANDFIRCLQEEQPDCQLAEAE